MNYIVHFRYEHMDDCKTLVPSIGDVMGGFWVDRYLEFTKGEAGQYWIPPSSIKYVHKVGD